MTNSLTIVAPNKNRLGNNNQSKFFLKSLKWQSKTDFNIIIVDGGSDNAQEVKQMVLSHDNASFISHTIGDVFLKCLLNNIGIRSARTPYIMTTDVDLVYGKDFVKTVSECLAEDTMIESRTLYWKNGIAGKVYSGEIDPETNLDACRVGRIKQRTTPGGCQCMHINSWNKIRGFDEAYRGWGSEDTDLVRRAEMSGLKIKWLGEDRNGIMLFHQPHSKNVVRELQEQEVNKRLLQNIKTYAANPNGWGGINDRQAI